MSWSYSGNPASSMLDAVRFQVQDTNEKAQLLQDEEIEFAITQEGETEELSAAALCCEVLTRRFAAQADTQFGSVKVTYSKQAEVYAKRAQELRERAADVHPPFAGGLSRSEKRALRRDRNRIDIPFRVGQFQIKYRDGRGGWGW